MKRHLTLITALVAALWLADATPVLAQTADDLFDPNTLQEIRLTIEAPPTPSAAAVPLRGTSAGRGCEQT